MVLTFETALEWVKLNYWIPIVAIALIIWYLNSKGVFKKKKRRKQDPNDRPPIPPHGSEFLDSEIGERGLSAERKQAEHDLAIATNYRERLIAEYKAAVEEHRKKMIYYRKTDEDLRIKITLLNKLLGEIDGMMETEKQLRGGEDEE